MRYYYLPPEEIELEEGMGAVVTPPLRCEYGGSPLVFESPHRYHKWVEEEYEVGLLLDVRTQRPRLDVKGNPMTYKAKRRKWVLDDEKNAKLDAGELPPPRNYMDLNEDCHRWVMRSVLAPLNLHLKSESEVKHLHDKEMELLRARQHDEIKALKAELEREKREALAQIEAARRKLAKKSE